MDQKMCFSLIDFWGRSVMATTIFIMDSSLWTRLPEITH